MNWFDILQTAGDRAVSMPWDVFLERLPERLAERFEEAEIEPDTPLVDIDADELPPLEPRDWVRVLSTLLEMVRTPGIETSSGRVIESPPLQPHRIITWAEERGIAARLEDPLRSIGQSWSWWTPRTTIREAMDRRAVSVADVRGYLTYALEEGKRAGRRSERARAPIADPFLARLRRRILAFRDRVFVREVLPEWLIRGAELSIDIDEGRAYLVAAHQRDVYLDLLVDDTSRLGRELRTGDERAELYQRLAELLLEVIVDPDEPQHEEVKQALNRQPWERLLGKISAAVGDATEANAAKEERLVWRVVEHEGRVVGLDAAIQKRTRRGWSRGRRIKASSTSLGRAVTPEDEAAVATLSLSPERARFPATLEALVGHPRVYLESTQQRVAVRRGRLSLAIRDEGEGRQLRFSLLGEPLDADELADGRLGPDLYARVDVERRRISIAKLEPSVARLAAAVLEAGDPPMPASADEALMTILGRLPETIGLDLPPELAGAPIESETRPSFRLTPEADEGLKVEKRLSDESIEMPESKALRHLFFADRLVAKVPGLPKGAKAPPLKKVAVVGAGTMGSGIATSFANAGVEVVLIDADQKGLDRGLELVQSNYDVALKRGIMTPEKAAENRDWMIPSRRFANRRFEEPCDDDGDDEGDSGIDHWLDSRCALSADSGRSETSTNRPPVASIPPSVAGSSPT